MSRLPAMPNRSTARRILGALLAVCVLALGGTTTQARPRFPGTIVLTPLRTQARASTNPGYLPLVGSPALRWMNPAPTAPTQTPAVLYNPAAPTSSRTGNSPSQPVTTTSSEPGKPPALQPKDFLPFFQRDNNPPPAQAGPNEGLLFAPARPTLPTSSADFRQQ